ncbi:MAG: radical SAM protein [Candidatus Hydrogenedentota bacterium]|nr:MAG: radical SAM protein [Candidatus Hydrogenedentota bacterium]
MEATASGNIIPTRHNTVAERWPGRREQRLQTLLRKAREISWRRFGKKITFYLPGMIRHGSEQGSYPAISITGSNCELGCDHCGGKILASMIRAVTPEELVQKCQAFARRGAIGCLLTGGSNRRGIMPWDDFVDAIAEVKWTTGLYVAIHTGIMPRTTALKLKAAKVDQALVDLIGSDDTVRDVYHLDGGVELVRETMRALTDAGIETAPHIVVGLHYGTILGEYEAIRMAGEFDVPTLVFVVLTSLKGASMEGVTPPNAEEVAELIALARVKLPRTVISLGCERSRGVEGTRTELLAIDAGVNRIAIQSDAAIEHAKAYGLDIRYQKSCCSMGLLGEGAVEHTALP